MSYSASTIAIMDSLSQSLNDKMDHFKVDQNTFLMGFQTPLLIVPLYLATLKILKLYVARYGAFDLRTFVSAYNLALSVGSGVLGYFLAIELFSKFMTNGLFNTFCDEAGDLNHGKLYVYYYINYGFKFIELFDTVFMVLRNKPTPFLHVYHHSATLVLCWSQLLAQSCIQWVPIQMNLTVHVVMYYYYFLVSMKKHVWWKKYLTQMQITQFIIALCACFVAMLPRELEFMYQITDLPLCWGTRIGAHFGTFILSSYLLLFIKLYFDIYSNKKQQGVSVHSSSSNMKKKEENIVSEEEKEIVGMRKRRLGTTRN